MKYLIHSSINKSQRRITQGNNRTWSQECMVMFVHKVIYKRLPYRFCWYRTNSMMLPGKPQAKMEFVKMEVMSWYPHIPEKKKEIKTMKFCCIWSSSIKLMEVKNHSYGLHHKFFRMLLSMYSLSHQTLLSFIRKTLQTKSRIISMFCFQTAPNSVLLIEDIPMS